MKKYKHINFLNSRWTWYLTHPWEVPEGIYKNIKSFLQRGWRGYAECDLWNFDSYLREILASGLKEYIKNINSYPGTKEVPTLKKWKKILEEMQEGFQAVIDYEETGWENDPCYLLHKKVYKKQEKSLKLLTKWFDSLWD